MKRNLAVLACFVLLLVVGCKSRQNLASRVVGTWAVDHQGKENAGQVVLGKDNHFSALAMPSDLFDDSDLDNGKAITGSGTWTLRNEGDSDRVGLRFERVDGVDSSHMPQEAELQVEGGRELVLFFDPGDPDEDERVTLHRQTVFSR